MGSKIAKSLRPENANLRKGNPGPCSQAEGLLSYDEIMDIIDDPSRNPTVWLDSEAAVKIAVFDDDQWVAYDDAETLQMKLDFANSECMGGYAAFLKMKYSHMILSLILIN